MPVRPGSVATAGAEWKPDGQEVLASRTMLFRKLKTQNAYEPPKSRIHVILSAIECSSGSCLVPLLEPNPFHTPSLIVTKENEIVICRASSGRCGIWKANARYTAVSRTWARYCVRVGVYDPDMLTMQ